MRLHILAALVLLAAAPLCARAAGGDAMCGPPSYPSGPDCAAPPRAPGPPPSAPPAAPQQPLMAAAPGMFVQPPASGTVRGPVEQRGVEGASITFPSLTLRCPSIHLPAWFHSRSNARMEIEAAAAPYVESYAAAPYAVSMAPQYYPTQPPSAPGPPSAPLPPPAAPPGPPRCDVPSAPYAPPRCDAPDAKHAALEQKLRNMEAAEQRLQLRIAELQQFAAQRDVVQPGFSLPQPILPTTNSLGPNAIVEPIGGPRFEPRFAPTAPAYPARPASYVAEPARLLPADGIIRQPLAPSGRILGVR